MPFDGNLVEPSLDFRASNLAWERRKKAAALWCSVPAEQFDISNWCGTAACALGWLAKEGVDGWEYMYHQRENLEDPVIPGWRDMPSVVAATEYFGLNDPWSGCDMFRNDLFGYGVADTSMITGSMVADRLLATPIYLNDSLRRDAMAMSRQETVNAV